MASRSESRNSAINSRDCGLTRLTRENSRARLLRLHQWQRKHRVSFQQPTTRASAYTLTPDISLSALSRFDYRLHSQIKHSPTIKMPGFDFSNYNRNAALHARGVPLPKATSTGTTIVGCIYNNGVVIAADTRATSGPIVADKVRQAAFILYQNLTWILIEFL